MCAKGFPPDRGGVQSYGEQVARAYLARGIEPVVMSARPGPRGWTTLSYPEGRLRLWNAGQGHQAVLFARMLAATGVLLAREQFDFCHATTWRPALAMLPWSRRLPLAITVHGREVTALVRSGRSTMRAVLRRADVIAAVSRTTLASARPAAGRPGRGRWIVSHNGLSYPAEASAFVRPQERDGPIRLFSFCRLIERKNIEGALDALALARRDGIESFDYAIAGDGPSRAAIAARIERLGLGDRVRLIGTLPEEAVCAHYRAADIFLHPQIAPEGGRDIEGFGLVIADAMSFGALAIAGLAGGPSDFIADGENGLLVDGTRPQMIAAALTAMIRDPARRRRIADEGRRWCLRNLSWDRHVGELLAAISGV